MADLSTFLSGHGTRLAPQLTGFSIGSSSVFTVVTGIDISTGADVLSLSGKYVIGRLSLSGVTASTAMTVVLTVDGETIWNDTITPSGTNVGLLGSADFLEPIVCNSSLTLNITQSGETDAAITYHARPIK